MLISDLMDKLEGWLHEYGDLPIFVYDDTYGDVPAEYIDYWKRDLDAELPERITIG